MPGFIAIEPDVFEPGDIVPTPIYATVNDVLQRIVDAGQPVQASHLFQVQAARTQVLIPAHMSSAFGDYAAGQFEGGHQRYFVALFVARLSHLFFGPISSQSLSALNRVATQLVRMPAVDLCQTLESPTLRHAEMWVKTHVVCAVLMVLVLREDNTYAEQMQGLVFAALIHDLDGLIRGTSDVSGPISDQAITLSVLARHFPVSGSVHEVLLHFRERADGSGHPFGYTASQIPRSAQYLGLLSTLAQDTQHSLMDPFIRFKTVRNTLNQKFTRDTADSVATTLSRYFPLSDPQ